jgi:hypothetical protein
MNLQTTLPTLADGRFPEAYVAAKNSLAECSKIDECKDWADKAEALASYAKQSSDDGLRKMANRIQARAIRRCGELLREFDGRPRNSEKQKEGTHLLLRREAGANAGLSSNQVKTAVRVANVNGEVFEAAVEGENPPTVTALAEQGTKKQLIDLQGRDPEEFSISTQGQGRIQDLADFAKETDPKVVVSGALDFRFEVILENISAVSVWLERIKDEIQKGKN